MRNKLAKVAMMSLVTLAEQNQPAPGDLLTAASVKKDNEGLISARRQKWATGVLLAYFGARLLFFAMNISSFIPPDEVTHAGICTVFSKVFLLPDNSPATYEFGLVTNIPWLYYWAMGKLLHLNFFGLPDLKFLRLLNIPLAFGTVFCARRTLLLLTRDRLVQLLLLVVVTNTAMFSLLSASVSYDNLTNLLAAMAIYCQFAFLKKRTGGLLIASLLCQMAGSLTKVTFLPLILALNLLLLVFEGKNLLQFPAAAGRYFRASARRAWLTITLLLVASGLNLHLYAGNYLKYGTLTPPMSEVLSPAAAMNYRLDARGTIFNRYKEGTISYMDALIMTGDLKHPGDKADLFYLLMNYEKLKRNPQLWLSPPAYAKVWFTIMIATIFGIKGHLGMFKSPVDLIPVYAVFALAVLGFITRWRPRESGWIPPGLAAVAVFYSGYLMYEVNYDSYLNYGEPSLTVYGRYLFPILVPVYVLMCHYLLLLFRIEYIRIALALATSLLFIAYDFPWFLAHVTPEWSEWLPR
jgi:hypothetical protein